VIGPTATVDLDAVGHNAGEWHRFLAPKELWAVVKSDGYGLGATDVARAALSGGATRLCVIELDEAKRLRHAGIRAPIVQVAATPPSDFFEALDLDVAVTLENWRAADTLDKTALKKKTRAAAHVAIDCGTGWSGLQAPDVRNFAKQAARLEHIRWEGVWTHLGGPRGAPDQIATFGRAVETLREAGLRFQYQHVASTAPAIGGAPGDAARIGIGLFGSTMGERSLALDLRTALTVRASVASVKRFESASALGYGGTARAEPGAVVATLRLGYADGLPRGLANRGLALFGAERCKIVGAIGMNFTFVMLPAHFDVSAGDECLIVGEADGIRLDDVASAANTIPHELCTSFSRIRSLSPSRPA